MRGFLFKEGLRFCRWPSFSVFRLDYLFNHNTDFLARPVKLELSILRWVQLKILRGKPEEQMQIVIKTHCRFLRRGIGYFEFFCFPRLFARSKDNKTEKNLVTSLIKSNMAEDSY